MVTLAGIAVRYKGAFLMITPRWGAVIFGALILLIQQAEVSADSVEERVEKAKIAQIAGDYTKAVEELTRAIRLGSSTADLHLRRALSYEKLGNYREAINDYDRAIQLDPRSGMAYNNRGSVYYHLGNFDKAIA